MVTRLDLHLHSRGSDGWGTPDEFVKAIQASNLDGIVLSDHHRTLTKEGLEVIKAVRAAGLVALVSCEYSTKEGHCLVFGLDVMKLGLGFYPSMQTLIDAVAAQGGVAFPSHPFRGVKETLGDKIYTLAGLTHVEAFNGQNEAGNGWASSARPEANQKAVWAAEKMGLAQTGGSDAHQPERIGTCYTEFAAKIRTTVGLVAALKAKDHVACVNREMVEYQKATAKQWATPSWKGTQSYSSVSESQMSWWDGDDEAFWRDVTETGSSTVDAEYLPSYPPSKYEADSDEDIPDHAFGSEDPEDVQAFLRREASKQKRRPNSGWKKSSKRTAR